MWKCAALGDQLNAYDIFNVDEGRRLYPALGGPEQSWKVLPKALYRQWINTIPAERPASTNFTWQLPHVKDGHVTMATARVTTEPAPVAPVVAIEVDGEPGLAVVWPPPDRRSPMSVSPETKSPLVYGALRRERVRLGDSNVDLVLTERDPEMRATQLWLMWPGIFGEMFKLGGNLDVLEHHRLMRQAIHLLSGGQSDSAMRIIENWVQRLTGEAEASIEKAWFMPKFMNDRNEALWAVEGNFGIAANDIATLAASQEFRQRMSMRIPVRRTHGWLGYFWWELYQDAQSRVSVGFCQSCGGVIRGGHTDRRYCTREENADCVRQRNAAAQKKGRASKRRHSQHSQGRAGHSPQWA